ncbi:MAG: ABC transporter permease [Cryobacterium sp.]|nr:ABC transporter permease [Cryobacterium sp.]
MIDFLVRRKKMLLGLVIIGVFVILGLWDPFAHSATTPSSGVISLPPDGSYWFGTDANGFDIFSRTFVAAPRDISLALAGTVVSLIIGTVLGLFAGRRGYLSAFIVRGLDVFQSFPLLILAITVITLLGNQAWSVIAAIAVINVPRFIRLVRSEALVLRESRFVEAAIAIGASPLRVLFRHILPNVREVILAQFSLSAANALMIITTMAFLGVGTSPPHPSWGAMAQDGARVIALGQWWVAAFPCIAIALCVYAFNLLADDLEHKR